MKIWNPNRQSKNNARTVAVEAMAGRMEIWLTPGKFCLDMKLGREIKTLSPQANLTLVENNHTYYQGILRYLGRARPRQVTLLLDNLWHTRIRTPLDYGFFDLFGNLTDEALPWIEYQLAPNTAPGAKLFFTFSLVRRNNRTVGRLAQEFRDTNPRAFEEFYGYYLAKTKLDYAAQSLCAQVYALNQRLPVARSGVYVYRDSDSTHTMALVALQTQTPAAAAA